MSLARTTRPSHLDLHADTKNELPPSNIAGDEATPPTISEKVNPLLTASENVVLETVHNQLDKLLCPENTPETLVHLLRRFRPRLDSPQSTLPIAFQQRMSTLNRQVRIATAALEHAHRVHGRLNHLRITLHEADPRAASPQPQRQRHIIRANSVPRKPLPQRLVEVLGGAKQYANYVDTMVLADIVRMRKKAGAEKGQLEKLLVVVRRALDEFWEKGEQWRGEALWGLFVAEARTRVAIMNMWAVEEANRLWVMKAVGRQIVCGLA